MVRVIDIPEAACMSQIRQTIDLEAEIEALIRQAGDSLRQPTEARSREQAVEQDPQQTVPSNAATS
jgi:hypothetical protein